MSRPRDWLIQKRDKKTQQEVADKAFIDRSYYTQIENGTRTPSVDVAKKIAKALRFKWTIFFENDCSEKQQNPKSKAV